MSGKVSAIIPIKLNSRRLPYKNFLTLHGKPLAYYIFNTLLSVESIDDVYCYTSQPQVLSLLPKGIKLLYRPEYLDGDDIKANQLFGYAVERVSNDIVIVCHATSPFIKNSSITKGIQAVVSEGYDSSFSVSNIQKYCWFKGSPINYNPSDMSQTQDLNSVYSETSGFYVFRKEDYLNNGTRINGESCLIEVDEREAVDIDNKSDFNLAYQLFDYQHESNKILDDRYFVDKVSNCFDESIEHVIFDLDGVLIDSINVMEQAWESVVEKYDIDIPFSSYVGQIGQPFEVILSNLEVDSKYLKGIESEYNRVSIERQDQIKIYEGIIDLLKRLNLNRIEVSIVTSKTQERTLSIIKEKFNDIEFNSIVVPESVKSGRGKPFPDQLLLAFVKSGISPENTIYIGDTEIDRMVARSANCRFIFAEWGYGSPVVNSDLSFKTVSDVLHFIFQKDNL
jgi:CMP-N-acetylneuraminic acid synthetase/beta-phosphoglucomutase-like phosphatase (HAD superfamily)